MKKIKTLTPILLILLSLVTGCSTSSSDVFISDPSEAVKETIPQEINFEIKVLNSDGTPFKYLDVALNTSSFHDQGITNIDGELSLITQRQKGEPLVFKFHGKDVSATEIVTQLPSTISSPSMVFEVVNEHKVRLSHYSVDGLYR